MIWLIENYIFLNSEYIKHVSVAIKYLDFWKKVWWNEKLYWCNEKLDNNNIYATYVLLGNYFVKTKAQTENYYLKSMWNAISKALSTNKKFL